MKRHWTLELLNHGLVASVLCLVLICAPAFAEFKVPEYIGYVNDRADVLSVSTEQSLETLATELNQKTKSQVAVLTVDSLDGEPVEQAALKVARQWGIGDKSSNSGLLILVAVKDHKLRTEIGYGLEGIITDGTSGEIQDAEMVPYFRQNNYEQGITRGALAYIDKIAEANHVQLTGDANNQTISQYREQRQASDGAAVGGLAGLLLMLLNLPWVFWLFIFLFIWSFIRPSHRRRGGFYGGPFIGGLGGGSFGGGGFSSSDGGFGGFGGGSFGGGGSSRSW